MPEKIIKILVSFSPEESRGRALESLCQALRDLTRGYPDVQVVFPLEFNANVRETALQIIDRHEKIHLLDPRPFGTRVEAMAESHLIITGSNGIKEQGLALNKPILLFQEKQETGVEFANEGAKATGLTRKGLLIETSRLLEDPDAYRDMVCAIRSPGDGHASERIIHAIKHYFGHATRPRDYKPKTPIQEAVINSKNPEMRTIAMH